MSQLLVQGKIHKIFDQETKGESFQVRDFVIETLGEYPQLVKFQLVQDGCSLVDSFKEGEEVEVHFNLRGREWNGKYFTNLNAWRINKFDESTTEKTSFEDVIKADGIGTAKEDDPFDDLPF